MAFVGKWFGFGRNESFDTALRSYESGEYAEAVDGLRAVASVEPDLTLRQRAKSYLAGALGRLGKSAIADGDYTSAVDYLGEAVVLRPRYADLHMSLALAHEALGEFSKRNEEVEAALRINPKYGMAVLFQASMMIMSGDHTNGLARAVQGVSLDRRLETPVFKAAIDLADAGKWEEAAKKLREVRPTGQEDPDFLSIRGDRMMAQHRYEDAAECFRNALELSPGYADLHVRYGQALFETDQIQRAMEEFREATSLNPSYAEAFALLGVTYRRLDQEDLALEAFRKALDLDPNQMIASTELFHRRPH